jgi:septation ring formation regulator EzrA
VTEGMLTVAAAVTTALVGGGWAVARMMIHHVERQIELMNRQLEKQIELMNVGLCTRLEDTEKARKATGEQWRALFTELRRQNRDIAVRIDHLEERIHQLEHAISQCHSCPARPSDLPE